MKTFKFDHILIIIIFSISCNLFSQDSEQELQVYDLQDTIVVVADRFKVPLKNLTYTHQVVDRSLVATLSTHSSLEVIDIAFPSAFTLDKKIIGYGVGREGAGSINMRGQGGRPNTGMLVLINGHPDFMSLFGHPLPDVYGIDDVQQIEILAGPSSTVFGSQAMAGIVNIKTKPDYNQLVRLSVEAGSHRTYNLGVNVNKSFPDAGVFFSARRMQTDGHIDQSGFKSYHFQAGAEYQINPTWQLSLHGRFVPYEFDDPSRGTADPAMLGTYAKIKRGTGEVILENNGKILNGSSQFYANWGDHRFYDGFQSKDFTIGVSSYQQWKAGEDLSLAGGVDLIQYGGRAENKNTPGVVNEDNHQLNSAGIYLLGLYSAISNTSLKLGLRYQYNSLPLASLSPVAGINYSVFSNLKLYANYQNGFRYPTLNELYLFPIANPDLKEERINSVEGGLWYFWAPKNSLRLTYYYNDVKNIIQAPQPPPPVPYTNSGAAIQQGIEAQVNFYVFRNFAVQGSYSYLDPNHITKFNPRHQIKYLLILEVNNIDIILNGKYVGQLYAENDSKSRLADYYVMNMILSWQIDPLKFNFKIRNLLNRKYESLPGYPAPAFHFFLGADYIL